MIKRDQDPFQGRKERVKCRSCWQPKKFCLCSQIKSFDPGLKFVILTHPIEARKRIATGRLTHACLDTSLFFRGIDFTRNKTIQKILTAKDSNCYVLYPGENSLLLNTITAPLNDFELKFPSSTYIFVIDGTWGNANKIIRLNPRIAKLPRVSFAAGPLSQFRVRQQPKPFCLSTIEATYEIIDILAQKNENPNVQSRNQNLLEVFNHMVEQQLQIISEIKQTTGLQHRPKKYPKKNKSF